MKKLQIISIISLFCSFSFVLAQNKSSQFCGEITYSYSYEDVDESMSSLLTFMPKSSTLYVKDSMTLSMINISGMPVKTIHNVNRNETIVLYEMAGNCIAVTSNGNESLSLNTQDILKNISSDNYVAEPTGEIKKICKHKCHGYNVFSKDSISGEKTLTNTIYIGENFLSSQYNTGLNIPNLPTNGFAFHVKNMANSILPMSIIVEITKIKRKTLDDSLFMIPENATRMTLEEFIEAFGGM